MLQLAHTRVQPQEEVSHEGTTRTVCSHDLDKYSVQAGDWLTQFISVTKATVLGCCACMIFWRYR